MLVGWTLNNGSIKENLQEWWIYLQITKIDIFLKTICWVK